jgi:uncharacterized membrane protein YeiH
VPVPSSPTLLLVLDLAGAFVFALDGGLTALRATRLDIVGVVTLAMITALGGGIMRDLVIGAIPPATFDDWRYLTVAAAGGLIAFVLAGLPDRLNLPINLLDAAGLSLFAVTGASKALDFGLGPGQAIILGAVTAVGGGTVRDVLIGRIPAVLHSGLYAIPALIGVAMTVAAGRLGLYGLVAALVAASVCFLVRLLGIVFGLDAPRPPRARPSG